MRARRGGADAVLGAFPSPAAASASAREIARLQPDALLIDTIFRAPVLREPCLAGLPSVLVAHDVFHRRHAALLALGHRLHPPTLSAADEARWLAPAGQIAAIQPEEAALLAALCPGKNVFLASPPVRPRPRPAGVARFPHRLVFVGSASPPNVDGLRWFLEAVWPVLRKREPRLELVVCGTAGGAIGRPPAGVSLRGVVRDLAPILHRAALAIAPLRAGSGLKIKLLDYVAHGLAVVTTAVGAAGMPDSPALHVAGDPPAMAALIAGLLRDDAAGREAAALALAARYAPGRVFGELMAALAA